MSKVLLREYYELCEGGVCQDLLTEAEKRFVAEGGMILSGIMQKADTQNGNGRVYPARVLMREVENYITLMIRLLILKMLPTWLQMCGLRVKMLWARYKCSTHPLEIFYAPLWSPVLSWAFHHAEWVP